ncbi:bifunctional 3'-5' exonuclease/DNA polymerase [Cellulomonas sp. HZM]|uniref:bifunctional 3'-5' exonuclease/DNA polymerase n=1 Tax=Cellulomonas sp. HZM TaxID=1454010 RepID=UPI0009E0AABA|nr:bifunctional 3'-5' exonuclease/DNA polymerase [Cellulomonas sp. HZM]
MLVAPGGGGPPAGSGARRDASGGAGAEVVVGAVGSRAFDGETPVRWVWDDTWRWYPRLLADGVRVERCLDLRLAHRVLRGSAAVAGGSALSSAAASALFDGPPVAPDEPVADSLFEVAPSAPQPSLDECESELAAQDDAVVGSAQPARLRLLLVAESAGALAAAEMRHAGMPWDRAVHDEVLTAQLGPRPAGDARPARMAELAAQVRSALDAPRLNPDSLPDVLRELRRNGLAVRSTSRWELQGLDHPAVEPLLAYKKLSRLHSANGWAWLDRWVPDGRFRPEYVVGGVVTGRWGSSGGGALQIPKQVRSAVRADEGWRLVVADAAQLEPRVLAGLARDERMAEAGRGRDLYAGIVDAGVVETRELAKVGMLGALYGGTTGASAAVLPRLARAFPSALGLVEAAARAGERGEVVSTLLGRSSPRPGAAWSELQSSALDVDAGSAAESRARAQTRAWGRFTRNFVVQGTAAEWALCWIADLRRRLWAMGASAAPGSAAAPFAGRPHLVYFLHDELVVHTPAAMADAVAEAVRAAAAVAGRLLFGEFPVDFPLTVASVESYAEAKG